LRAGSGAGVTAVSDANVAPIPAAMAVTIRNSTMVRLADGVGAGAAGAFGAFEAMGSFGPCQNGFSAS
jgi:hypothetical protein